MRSLTLTTQNVKMLNFEVRALGPSRSRGLHRLLQMQSISRPFGLRNLHRQWNHIITRNGVDGNLYYGLDEQHHAVTSISLDCDVRLPYLRTRSHQRPSRARQSAPSPLSTKPPCHPILCKGFTILVQSTTSRGHGSRQGRTRQAPRFCKKHRYFPPSGCFPHTCADHRRHGRYRWRHYRRIDRTGWFRAARGVLDKRVYSYPVSFSLVTVKCLVLPSIYLYLIDSEGWWANTTGFVSSSATPRSYRRSASRQEGSSKAEGICESQLASALHIANCMLYCVRTFTEMVIVV